MSKGRILVVEDNMDNYELVRFILLQHHQGQVTVERITALLTGLGLVISKRQVQRLLTGDVAVFAEEADEVLRTGLTNAPWITVDDTGARHQARNGVITQIGNDRFTFFATTFSKSRKNFLQLLQAGYQDYVINAKALDYMREHHLAGPVIRLIRGSRGQDLGRSCRLVGPSGAAWHQPP